MRTATTLHRTASGWKLASGPDVPADKQRQGFNSIGDNWPAGVLEVSFQLNDGPRKSRDKERATAIASDIRNAEAKAANKLVTADKMHAAAAAKLENERKAREKASAEENNKTIAEKEARKKAADKAAAKAIKPETADK